VRLRHRGGAPAVDATAWVAPNAVLAGDVRIGPGTAIGFGAVLTAEDGTIEIGAECVVMENAVLRAGRRAPLTIAGHCLVGPRAYLSGCTLERCVFVAAGATVFNGAVLGEGSEVRINGVVHISTRLEKGATVPIGWVAVGDPARILPPDRHDEIWAVQQGLDFPGVVFGLRRPAPGDTIMPELTRRYARFLAGHRDDEVVEKGRGK
jgi:carbonic anhydrase/acetyltransferase-like protein (isoleucine patch superfamily)